MGEVEHKTQELHLGVQLFHDDKQVLVPRSLRYLEVERAVLLEGAGDVSTKDRGITLRSDRGDRVKVFFVPFYCKYFYGKNFDRCAHSRYRFRFLGGEGNDLGVCPRDYLHQPVFFQAPQRLSHRRSADAESTGDRLFRYLLSTLELRGENHILDVVVHAISQGLAVDIVHNPTQNGDAPETEKITLRRHRIK